MYSQSTFQDILNEYVNETYGSDIPPRLSDSQKDILIKIVRDTLGSYLSSGEIPEIVTDESALMEPRATFVTLRNITTNELRGCKGEILPTKPLIESVQSTAISTAVSDPRFPSVTYGEMKKLKIEISILLPIVPINPEEIRIGKHGLVISRGNNTALLLPHVPIIYKLDRERFLTELSFKAGLPDKSWMDPDTSLYAFEADVFEEQG